MRAEDNEQKLCTFEMWVLFVSQKKKKKKCGNKIWSFICKNDKCIHFVQLNPWQMNPSFFPSQNYDEMNFLMCTRGESKNYMILMQEREEDLHDV